MNARERIGVALNFIAIAILVPSVGWIFWANGHNLLAFTSTAADIILGSTFALWMVGTLLVKGRPVTEVLRRKR